MARHEPTPPAGRPAPPAVPPGSYDADYFLRVCAGSDEWRASGGAAVAAAYPGFLDVARLAPGETVVDLGAGRGELVATAVASGAARAVGLEYSPDAARLAARTLAAHGAGGRAAVLLGDVRAAPLRAGCADLVTMLDVVEHLAPGELAAALREAFRLLRPGGRLVVHTFPSRTVYAVTYRLQRLAVPGRRRRWPADPRNDAERRLHVNEQTAGSLAGALRAAGFTGVRVWPGDWVYTDFVPDAAAARLYHRLAARRRTRRFGAANLFAEAGRP